eukprot:4242998-Prymnesium_polylepis.1
MLSEPHELRPAAAPPRRHALSREFASPDHPLPRSEPQFASPSTPADSPIRRSSPGTRSRRWSCASSWSGAPRRNPHRSPSHSKREFAAQPRSVPLQAPSHRSHRTHRAPTRPRQVAATRDRDGARAGEEAAAADEPEALRLNRQAHVTGSCLPEMG